MFITGRRETELDAAVEAIGSAATAVIGDISNPADLDRLYEMIRSRGQGLDVLFANASVAAFVPLEQITEEHFRHPLRHQRPGHAVHRSKGICPCSTTAPR